MIPKLRGGRARQQYGARGPSLLTDDRGPPDPVALASCPLFTGTQTLLGARTPSLRAGVGQS